MAGNNLFITGTDTGIGKTLVTYAVGLLLQKRGVDVGVMKPVQCSGDDAEFLTNELGLMNDFRLINPYYAPDPTSPRLAFERRGETIELPVIREAFEELNRRHEILLVEGAGGLLVPLREDYMVIDLIRDLDCEAVIVARLGLGTINHTLMSIESCRRKGIRVRGVIYNQTSSEYGTAEKTNPEEIERISGIPTLGVIPYLKDFRRRTILDSVSGTVDLDRLIRPLQKKRSTARWREADRKTVWHPFTQMKDWQTDKSLVIERGEGNYLIDTDGRRYLDGVSSLWVNVHGHNHPALNTAIHAQLEKIAHSTLLGLAGTPSIAFAEELCKWLPDGLEKVFFSDSGSTAVEIGIKLAYQYWQNLGRVKKTKIAHLAHAYHGDTLGSVSVGGIDLFHKMYGPLTFETIEVPFPDCYRAPEGKVYPDYAFECVDAFEKMMAERHEEIACFVVEPLVQGAAGMIVWPEGILKRMADICRKYDVLLVLDEVATGFGRTGTMFACEQEGVVPDLLCLAKGISGGYLPLACTVASRRVYEGFLFDYKDCKTFFHGHTYTGNALACAAGLANLKIFRKEKVLERLPEKIRHLEEKLKMFYNLPLVGDVRQKGLMAGIELTRDRATREPFPWEDRVGVKICDALHKHGIILRPLGNVIVLMPPLSVTIEEIDHLLNSVYLEIENFNRT